MRRIGARAIVCIAAGATVGVALSQYALDASTRIGSSARNQRAPAQQMAAPIYSVSSVTGDMVYNRANAFRDPSYDIYQSRFMTGSGYAGRSSGPNNRADGVLARERSGAYSTGAVVPASRPVGASRRVSQASAGLRQPAYSAARAPSTRVSTGRVSGRTRR